MNSDRSLIAVMILIGVLLLFCAVGYFYFRTSSAPVCAQWQVTPK